MIYIYVSAFASAEVGVSPKAIGLETSHFAENSFSARLQKEFDMETTGWFDGKPAKIRHSGGTTEIFYGGAWGNIPGDGHGHVKAQGGPLGEFIVYWRLPESEGGATVIDNWASSERFSDHMSGLW